MLKTILLTAVLLITLSAHAEEGSPINKQQWMENMKNTLPALLCQPDQYFIQCFQTTQKECLSLTQPFVAACLNNTALSLPTVLTLTDRKEWGQIVGRCSYDLYEKFMSPHKQNRPACQEHTTQ